MNKQWRTLFLDSGRRTSTTPRRVQSFRSRGQSQYNLCRSYPVCWWLWICRTYRSSCRDRRRSFWTRSIRGSRWLWLSQEARSSRSRWWTFSVGRGPLAQGKSRSGLRLRPSCSKTALTWGTERSATGSLSFASILILIFLIF